MNLDVLEAELAAVRALYSGDWPAAARALRQMVRTRGISVLGQDGILAEDGVRTGHLQTEPLVVSGNTVATLVVYDDTAAKIPAALVRDVSAWAAGQLERAKSVPSRQLVAEAELRALRAQIRPHFMYSVLSGLTSLVRTNPERARRLLLDFADFTRYSFRRHGDFTTLAEEFRSIDQYLTLERARFGERLKVTLQVAPEVLPVTVPFLCLQPLVENAVRHGMEGKVGPGHIQIYANDGGAEAHITIEDDGIGMDPEKLRRTLADESAGIGLGNIDERLRRVYGAEFGLVIETAIGAGTKVTVRIPKRARAE